MVQHVKSGKVSKAGQDGGQLDVGHLGGTLLVKDELSRRLKRAKPLTY